MSVKTRSKQNRRIPQATGRNRANPANAQHSTGPRTPEGQARSSRNALKHGLLARYIIPAEDPVENPDEYNCLVEELVLQFQPHDLFETLCVKRIAACYWRLDRAMRFESTALSRRRQNAQNPLDELSRELLGTGQFDPANMVLPSSPELDQLIRYEYMIDRELQRTLTQLRQHRAESPQANPDPSTALSPPYQGGAGGGARSQTSISNHEAPAPIEPNPPSPLQSQISNLKSPPSVPASLRLPLPPSPPRPLPLSPPQNAPRQTNPFPHPNRPRNQLSQNMLHRQPPPQFPTPRP